MYAPTPQSVERSWNTQTVKRLSMSPPPLATTLLSNGHHDDDPSAAEPPKKKVYSQPREVKRPANPRSQFVGTATTTNSSDVCHFCGKRVYLMERMSANGFFFHRICFRCSHCNCQLKIGGYSLSKGERGGFSFSHSHISMFPFPCTHAFFKQALTHAHTLTCTHPHTLTQLVTRESFSVCLTIVNSSSQILRPLTTPGRGRGGGKGQRSNRWKYRNPNPPQNRSNRFQNWTNWSKKEKKRERWKKLLSKKRLLPWRCPSRR